MGAPKGNEFWKLRSKHGRDKIFKTPELLWQAACEYFEWCIRNPIEAEDNKGTRNINVVKFNRPFTKDGFYLYIDVSQHWLDEFKKTADNDFLYIIYKIEMIIRNQKFEGAVIGIFNANIIARDLGLVDKSDITSKGESIGSVKLIRGNEGTPDKT